MLVQENQNNVLSRGGGGDPVQHLAFSGGIDPSFLVKGGRWTLWVLCVDRQVDTPVGVSVFPVT